MSSLQGQQVGGSWRAHDSLAAASQTSFLAAGYGFLAAACKHHLESVPEVAGLAAALPAHDRRLAQPVPPPLKHAPVGGLLELIPAVLPNADGKANLEGIPAASLAAACPLFCHRCGRSGSLLRGR